MSIPHHRVEQMSGIEATVYEHVPIEDWFSTHAIHALLAQAGTTVSIQQTTRVLETLTTQGILRRRGDSHRGEFQRAKVKPAKQRRTLTIVKDTTTDEGPREEPQERPSLEGLACILGDVKAAAVDAGAALTRVRQGVQAAEAYIERLDQQQRAEAENLEELKALGALLDRRAARMREDQ